tara:strand:- start:1387 stop:2238 length:852 start_codon:yes stop_codon:yes gene_type:complete
MRDVYYELIDYKEVQPIGFWVILIGLIVLFVLFAYVFKNIQNGKAISKSLMALKLAIIIALISSIANFYNSIYRRSEDSSISNSEYIFGIDISHHQGRIDWREMRTSHHPIEFVFIKATEGTTFKDPKFKYNWKNAKKYHYIRGAYHFYSPNSNSTKQFENYKSNVKIKEGDFIPILDIEQEGRLGSKNLRKGVLNWLKLAEKEYAVKPMIYTNLNFYRKILKGYVDGYPLWIAAYEGKRRVKNEKWTFHQFTEKVKIKGVDEYVDGSDFRGTIEDLKKMCKK